MTNTYKSPEYLDAKKKLDSIKNRNFTLFRMGLFHLLDVGYRHLDEESVTTTCKAIMESDEFKDGVDENGNRTVSVITPEFACEIVKTAAEIATVPMYMLMRYIHKNIEDCA